MNTCPATTYTKMAQIEWTLEWFTEAIYIVTLPTEAKVFTAELKAIKVDLPHIET